MSARKYCNFDGYVVKLGFLNQFFGGGVVDFKPSMDSRTNAVLGELVSQRRADDEQLQYRLMWLLCKDFRPEGLEKVDDSGSSSPSSSSSYSSTQYKSGKSIVGGVIGFFAGLVYGPFLALANALRLAHNAFRYRNFIGWLGDFSVSEKFYIAFRAIAGVVFSPFYGAYYGANVGAKSGVSASLDPGSVDAYWATQTILEMDLAIQQQVDLEAKEAPIQQGVNDLWLSPNAKKFVALMVGHRADVYYVLAASIIFGLFAFTVVMLMPSFAPLGLLSLAFNVQTLATLSTLALAGVTAGMTAIASFVMLKLAVYLLLMAGCYKLDSEPYRCAFDDAELLEESSYTESEGMRPTTLTLMEEDKYTALPRMKKEMTVTTLP